jgi:hypothetical protein
MTKRYLVTVRTRTVVPVSANSATEAVELVSCSPLVTESNDFTIEGVEPDFFDEEVYLNNSTN